MEEFDHIENQLLNTGDLSELLIRFVLNSIFTLFIIHKLYYPKSQRKEYYFTFAIISASIFFLIFMLGSVKIKVGFALGLFAIFGIIRYRTETMCVREMTYLFVIITISVINALSTSASYMEMIASNIILILSIFVCERFPRQKKLSEKLVLYDRAELITPEKHDELMEDLTKRLGIKIEKVEIGAVDFMRDAVMIKVFYAGDPNTDTRLNNSLKLPKN